MGFNSGFKGLINICHIKQRIFLLWRCDPTRAMASSFLMFLDHTQWRTTVGRTHLDERSARRRDLYLTTHNTHNRQIYMPPVGFEPTISAGERPQTYALDRVAVGTGMKQRMATYVCCRSCFKKMNFVGITASGDGIAPLEFVWWSPCNTSLSLSEKQ